jgi:hypothetical protein
MDFLVGSRSLRYSPSASGLLPYRLMMICLRPRGIRAIPGRLLAALADSLGLGRLVSQGVCECSQQPSGDRSNPSWSQANHHQSMGIGCQIHIIAHISNALWILDNQSPWTDDDLPATKRDSSKSGRILKNISFAMFASLLFPYFLTLPCLSSSLYLTFNSHYSSHF